MAVLRVLPRLCHQGPDVPVPYLAARCARGSANGRFSHPCRRPAENGDVRLHSLLAAVLPRCRDDALGAVAPDLVIDHRHHLRRAGLADAEGYEEAGGVLFGQPPRLLHTRYLRRQPAWTQWLRHSADQSWYLDRSAVLDCRHSV